MLATKSLDPIHNSFFAKRDGLVMRVVFSLFIIGTVIAILVFIRGFFFSNTLYVSASMGYMNPGSPTGQFISELKGAGFEPLVLGQKIKRQPFSVNGQMVVLNGDNVQVFEYSNHDTALREATQLAQRYATNNIWKDKVHLYVKDTLIVFYLGTQKDILGALNKTGAEEIRI